MNMMDRVNIGNGRLFGLEEDLKLKGDQFQLAVSVLFVTYCVSQQTSCPFTSPSDPVSSSSRLPPT